jgi:butyryl-CoA dehydrogenase
VGATVERARQAGVEPAWGDALSKALGNVVELTMELGAAGMAGEVERMLRHSADYMELFSVLAVSWRWLAQAAAAREGLARGTGGRDFYEGKLAAAQYWLTTELPRVTHLVALCRSGEDSYTRMRPEWF